MLEIKVVSFEIAANTTTLDGTKLDPFTVRVKAAPPARAELGLKDVSAGTGLLTRNARAEEVPPPGAGVVTVTLNEAPTAMSGALIEACN